MFKYIYKMTKWLNGHWFMLTNRKSFNYFGKNACVLNPLKVDGLESITISDFVTVHEGTWLAAKPLTGSKAELIIEEGAVLGHYNHIYATQSIIIGKNVLTADKVYISDNLHNYENVDIPVLKQGIKQCQTVEIGEGSWLGENVCVIGSSIGKHCIIGANSVVTHNIPDFSLAVGAPAKVIKRFDFQLKKWTKMV